MRPAHAETRQLAQLSKTKTKLNIVAMARVRLCDIFLKRFCLWREGKVQCVYNSGSVTTQNSSSQNSTHP